MAKMTSNWDGSKEMKSCIMYDVVGSLDILNSEIGICDFGEFNNDKIAIQSTILDIGAYFSSKGEIKFEGTTDYLEKQIDYMTDKLPKLTNFILPQHQLHVARAWCRYAERKVVKFFIKEENRYLVNENIMAYLNRLSDYLFTLARYRLFKQGLVEIVYRD